MSAFVLDLLVEDHFSVYTPILEAFVSCFYVKCDA